MIGREISKYNHKVEVSSSSTKVFKCPHTKNNSIFTHKGLPIFSNRHLFQLTQDQKGLSKACNRAECKGMVIQAQ
ncbi:hypothetical protein H5410_000102 [Solanum commersonii]|uniref:Uncharacterized protein n=1 Tax=Solanum commersonii TaxID=4109 RepID=A0A9J6AVJ8_SOLCO|nr:hypothetical protein H5410_000102 [Solanum commersonii]